MAVTAERAFDLLDGAHQRARLAHAFLISGPAGSGKRALAARIVQLVNPPGGGGGQDLFGETKAAPEVADLEDLEGEFVRIVRPRLKSRRISIAEVRELERSLHLAAPADTWKVGVIEDADRMFEDAANAFLKTLEEPPPRCLLLLLTARPEVLLPTIRSRCVGMVLLPAARHDVLEKEERDALTRVLAADGGAPSPHRALLLKAGFESLLAARKAAIEDSYEVARKEEADRYGRSTEGDWLEERERYFAAMAASDYLAVRAALVEWLMTWLGDAVCSKVGVSALALPEYATETGQFGERLELDALLVRLDALQGLQELLSTNVHEALALEVSFLRAFGD